jgi:cathepsin B
MEQETTWTAGENDRFCQLKLGDAIKLLGALKSPEEFKLPVKQVQIVENLPENFDLREAHPQCEALKEVRDQSSCGSCWAFGAGEAMSDRICIASKGQHQTRVSTEHILSCCDSCGFGCNGGYPAAAWQFWQENGIPTGGLYGDKNTCQPYSYPPCDHHVEGKHGPCDKEYPTPDCMDVCQKGYPFSVEEDKWYAGSAYSVPSDEKSIMSEIYEHGSVEVAFDVYEDFLNYKSGVYQHVKGQYLGGHAVKMIGWGVEKGTKYWLLVNSWNEGWGDNGTFKILRGKNHMGVEGEIVAGTPVLKKSSKFMN